jgi:AGCS family alanine or glycine:cation symporter
MLGTFIDTIVICTITGLVIVASGAWQTGASGASLTASAFDAGLPVIGQYIVTLGLAVFAFTTIIGWSFYGERCTEYLFGIKAVPVFRLIWVAAIPIGATQELNVAWLIADTLNAMMALPNLVALILLSPVVFGLTREYLQKGSQKDL